MLKHLSVQNYALIDKLEVEFSEGLTIITGETGAGKSILLGALGLISGSRADTQSLQDKTKKCIVEASFNIKGYALKDFFKANELDYEITTAIRREINPEGKSRAFINDTPVTLSQLKELGEFLIDIHSQHQTLTLNGSEFQLSVVDAFAKHADLLEE
ncbi:MAG: AAA family ATPase, partial [Bacteroidetes bacterium]|nr:AAA family ATPase [Bacteroidota bacterium]